MKQEQLDIYTSEIDKLDKTAKIDVENKLIYISNIIYPNKSDRIEDKYGEIGFDNCFKKSGRNQYSYKKDINNFLDLDLLENYSVTIKSIIESINKSEGIVFIYSNWLHSILPLVLSLEQNDIKYNDHDILLSDDKKILFLIMEKEEKIKKQLNI